MNQQIQQLLKTVQNRQAKISKEQTAVDEKIKQIEKMVEQENKSWKDYWKVPEKTFENYAEEYRRKQILLIPADTPEFWYFKEKMDLLWYMIKDKEGDLYDLSDVISVIFYRELSSYDAATDVSEEVLKLLPEKFIDSFKNSKL